MQHEIQYSVIERLKALGYPVVWIYDGVDITKTPKPFITVESMQNNVDILAKRREAVETTYRFQVGLRATGATQKARLQSLIADVFIYDVFPLYSTAQSPATVIGEFTTDLTAVSPIPAESTDMATNYHRVYFDVEVPHVKTRITNN